MQCKVLLHLAGTLVFRQVQQDLALHEGASQVRLCELTDVEPMMMVRILDRMEADKLLERRTDPADRRARRLYLTRKAAPILDEIDRISELTRNEVFAGVSKADREAFRKVLERAHENACSLEAATPAAEAPAIATVSRRRARVAGR